MLKEAVVIYRLKDNNTRWTLRAGAKGTGRIIHVCLGWDNSLSDEKAEGILRQVAKREGYKIVAWR